MPGFGFGHGFSRQRSFQVTGVAVVEQISQHGVTFAFTAPRPAGQYANGDWWVLGPVTINSISPVSATVNGISGPLPSAGNTTPAYAGRVAHGTMVNPGNRVFATGGLLLNSFTNSQQGWDGMPQLGGVQSPIYNAAFNVDPGATGAPLVVASGSVVKFVSRLANLPVNNRPSGDDMVVLTVVDRIPVADAIRPGVSRAGPKISPCRVSDFNLAVFQNLAPTASAPTYAQALDWIDRYHETSMPDSINNPITKGINNHPEYGRDIANNLHRALLCLHLSSFTAAQKRTLLSHFGAIADDLVSRAEEGSVTLGAGGGNSWKLPVIVTCAAALGARAPASWTTWLSLANRNVWCENSQIFTVGGQDIALPRFTGDGRPRSAYTQQMFGAYEWGEQPVGFGTRSGSNWGSFYRDIVSYSLYSGVLAVELTTGGKALWDHPAFWLYMDTVFLRRAEGGAGNTLPPFPLEMTNAYRPAKVTVPAIVEAGIKDAAIWLRFDHALNELAAVPATGDFVVNVNGSPVAISSVTLFRQNCGLALAAVVTGNDVVTVTYTGGTNKLRSVDNVNVPNFTGRALVNRTDKVGGPNAAYPVVRFTPGTVRGLGVGQLIGAANGQLGTMALLKFKFTTPAVQSRIFGLSSGACAVNILLNPSGTIEVRLSNAAGGFVNRPILIAPLQPGVEYDIVWSFDNTQATAAAGANCFINGAVAAISNSNYTAGGIIGWNNNTRPFWNSSDNATFEFGAFWLDTTARLDLTNPANRAKFNSLTGGNLDIRTRGDGITGAIPSQFHIGSADQWNDGAGMNRGTSGKMFVSSGLVTQVSGREWV